MIAPAHIKIGKKALEETSINKDYEIYRKVYLFGCIAPDINFIYPLHNIQCTPKRFIKRIERMGKIKSKVIRSFTLGVIMHYICDYFCLAHNNQSYGAKHTLYERLMSHKLTIHEASMDNLDKTLEDYWRVAIEKYENGGICDIDRIIEEQETQRINRINKVVEMASLHKLSSIDIFKLVKNMNEQYIDYVKSQAKNNWFTDVSQMQTDLNWSLFMCERIGELVLA